MPGAARIEDYLGTRIAAGDFPGASYLVAEGRRILAAGAVGLAVQEPDRIPATTRTLYDLASLTKPLATALIAIGLRSEEKLRLEDLLSRHLPAWVADDVRSRITLLDLLTHRSGLPAWQPLYLHAGDRDGRIELLRRVSLIHPPGKEVVYSDLGYILLGFALEKIGGGPLDRLFAARVSRPLGIKDLLYRPPRTLKRWIAATEKGNQRERELAGEAGDRYNGWRTEMIWGEVHDNNAHTLGGVSGNAGLFGTARAVHTVALEFLGVGDDLLPPEARPLFQTSLTAGRAEERAVGFQIATTPGCSAGPAIAKTSFGHSGFTGTSLWIDPESRRIYILLTNRVHPRFAAIDMNAIRRGFHEVAAGL